MEHYYLRMRGQISGPYSIGQLHNLRIRGQFGRFHEVSPNQVDWVPAGSIPALFLAGMPSTPAIAAPVVLEIVAEWYYLDRNNQQQGPVSMRDLQVLLDTGQAEAGTHICKRGLSAWVPLDSFPQLRLPQMVLAGTLSHPTEQLWMVGIVLTALLIGIMLALLVGVIAAVTAGYLAVDSFVGGQWIMSWFYLGLLLLVLALTSVSMCLLALESKKRMYQEELPVSRGSL